jgi:DNA ligase-1
LLFLPKNYQVKQFAALISALANSTKTNDKLQALVEYFSTASDDDQIYTLALFTDRRPKRAVNTTKLREWCTDLIGIPLWLFEESYQHVGDLSETIALAMSKPSLEKEQGAEKSLKEWIVFLQDLQNKAEEEKKIAITQAWKSLDKNECFIFNKLMGGNFRIGVSKAMIINALSRVYKIDAQVVAHQISGNWQAENTSLEGLIKGNIGKTDISKPYPFYLAYPLEGQIQELGKPQDWQAEWKWDGMRGQIIKRSGEVFVWSRGEELITDKFPEYQVLKKLLPDGIVLDGEILPFKDNKPLIFSVLQTRIGRKNLTKKILQEAPVIFYGYDVLEYEGKDTRKFPLSQRRELLSQIINGVQNDILRLSPLVNFNTWEELAHLREQARENGSEGLMLKAKNSIYQAGRRRGDWWKWKVNPLSIDCVLVAAQKGHGRRANLYTDYTFALRDGEKLVTFTKAYSGLTDKEFEEVNIFIQQNILDKFGPVRTVKPELVFELGFEGIAPSNRHKSGMALRFPRILRWRKDKKINEINTLDDLRKML